MRRIKLRIFNFSIRIHHLHDFPCCFSVLKAWCCGIPTPVPGGGIALIRRAAYFPGGMVRTEWELTKESFDFCGSSSRGVRESEGSLIE
jgi:hypothetical protein